MNGTRLIGSLALALGLSLAACAHEKTVSPPNPFEERKLPAEVQADAGPVVTGNTAFALDLYAKLRARDGNLFLSPYSISTALAMTWAGARGATEQEMAQVLHFTLPQERLHVVFGALQRSLDTGIGLGAYRLSIANRLWGQDGYPWLASFLDITRESYGAELAEMDFRQQPEPSRLIINQWIEEKTEGKIQDLMGPGSITELTRLVLTNAIYFKGSWESRFKEADTQNGTFYLTPTETIQVPLMHQEGEFLHGEVGEIQVLELAYSGKDLSMLLLLPVDRDGLAELEEQLNPGNLALWRAALRGTEIPIVIPRFRFTSSFDLVPTLAEMGMPSAFDTVADFSGMDGTRSLAVTGVVHKAFVNVNEEGTEAAAATAVVVGITSVGTMFVADHPFLFLIMDNVTGSVLFLGRVANPGA